MKKSILLIIISLCIVNMPLIVFAAGKDNVSLIAENASGNGQTTVGEQDCTSLLGSPSENYTPAFYLTKAFHVLKYAGIVILVVMSVIDFVTAVTSNDNDAIIKATRKTLIRLVFCAIIFLLPDLIEFVLKYLNDRAIDLCGIE